MLSAIVITKNEQINLDRCLKSLRFCDELLVIDDFSEDKTVAIAKENNATVFSHPSDNDFAAQRNYGLTKAKGDWLLFIDADEVVSKDLAKEIQKAIRSPRQISGYKLKRLDHFLGRPLRHGETSAVKLLRLAKAGTGVWSRPVHEVWTVEGKTKMLSTPLEHYPHLSIAKFLDTVNKYTSIEAKLRLIENRKWSIWETLTYPTGKFFYNYFYRLGLLDGFPGLAMAYIMSLHSLMVRIKLYEHKIKQ